MTVYSLTGLSGGSPIDGQAKHAVHIALYRNGEIQFLVLHQVAIRDALPAAGNDSIFDRKLILWCTQPIGS